jgi:hypothetical protein
MSSTSAGERCPSLSARRPVGQGTPKWLGRSGTKTGLEFLDRKLCFGFLRQHSAIDNLGVVRPAIIRRDDDGGGCPGPPRAVGLGWVSHARRASVIVACAVSVRLMLSHRGQRLLAKLRANNGTEFCTMVQRFVQWYRRRQSDGPFLARLAVRVRTLTTRARRAPRSWRPPAPLHCPPHHAEAAGPENVEPIQC